MDSNQAIQQLIDVLKASTIAQPFKNYCLSDALRLQALIEKGMTAPPKTEVKTLPLVADSALYDKAGCFCVAGQKPNANCPVHGIKF